MRKSHSCRPRFRAQANRSNVRRLLLESLERRELLAPLALASAAGDLLSAAVPVATAGSVVLQGQTLLVTGTPGNDDIWIQSKKNGLFVSLNGQKQGPFQVGKVEVSG